MTLNVNKLCRNQSKFRVSFKDAIESQTMYKYFFCSIIFLTGLVLCSENSRCIKRDEPENTKCSQLVDDDELKKKQQLSMDTTAICNQKQTRETAEEHRKKKDNQIECKREKKVKNKCVTQRNKTKQKERSCAIQLRIDRFKSQSRCGIIKPSHCINNNNKTQIMIQSLPLQQQKIETDSNKTEECLNKTKQVVNSTKSEQRVVKKSKRKSKKSAKRRKGCGIFAAATPLEGTSTGLGLDRPKAQIKSILRPRNLQDEKCNRNGLTRRRKSCGQCLCNVNILDCLLGDIPANYLKRLRQKLEEQKKCE